MAGVPVGGEEPLVEVLDGLDGPKKLKQIGREFERLAKIAGKGPVKVNLGEIQKTLDRLVAKGLARKDGTRYEITEEGRIASQRIKARERDDSALN